ncbi:hypothetical protein PENSPDRAFT_624251 [Peniophora sp. CONT]|nr:hypothetical protein PENSPDRAFT_624251 [Peniophora sp. CONT]
MASTPSATPRSQALTTTTNNAPAVPSRSLLRQNVLEEDEYTAALSHIIARDFFPSLVHLDATNAFLEAEENKDPVALAASVRRLEELQTPARAWDAPTPYAAGPSETPRAASSSAGEPPRKRAKLDASLSLDAFQAKYTSEDNASFLEILDAENARRKEKYGWAWDAQKRVEAQRGKMLEGRERAMIEAPAAPGVREKVLIEAPVPKGLITQGEEGAEQGEKDDKGKGKEVAVVAKKDEEEEVDVMAPTKDTREAGVDGWNFRARNGLMYPPDADTSPFAIVAPSAPDPREIRHVNTRMPDLDEDGEPVRGSSAPPSPTRSRIDAAIAGTPYRPRSPGVNNFSYVPAMPSPSPAELGPARVKQLMTMGTLLGTPRVLSQSDDPAIEPDTPFRIAKPTAREQLSQRLSLSASRSLRAKADMMNGTKRRGDMGPPTGGMTPRRADAPGSLTPAAKRLLDRSTLGTAAARRAEAMGRMAGWEGKGAKEKDLSRVRWTPTPGR